MPTSRPQRALIGELTKALSLDENDSDVHRVLAAVNLTVHHNYDKALYHQERALALNPNDDLIVVQQGEVLSWIGQAEEGIEWIQKATGVFTRPTHKTDVPLALTNDCFWERNDSKIELTAKLRGGPSKAVFGIQFIGKSLRRLPVEKRIYQSHNFEDERTSASGKFCTSQKTEFWISPQFEGAFGRTRKKPRHANAGAKVRRVVWFTTRKHLSIGSSDLQITEREHWAVSQFK